MILTGREIYKQYENGSIQIDPFEYENLNPNSYNYRLGDTYRISKGNIDFSEKSIVQKIPESGLRIQPGQVILSTTNEIIGSDKFVTSLIGRSSVGRLGLFLQISADLGQLGGAHKWTLELTCVQPIIVYPKMKIGQVSFWMPLGSFRFYTGSYTKFDSPKCCMDLELNGLDK